MQKAPLPQATHGLREIRNIFTLASVIVLGTCLRLLHLGQKSYWWDEIVTVKLCRLPFSAFRAWVWKFEANMAFYLLVLRPWLHFGTSEAWVRLPSAIAAVACIPIIYLIGDRLSGKSTGLTAGLLLAVSVIHIAYAQEARSYSLLMLLCVLSLLFFVRIPVAGRGNVIVYTLVSALAVYTHFFAVFYLLAQWASVVALRIREMPWKKFLAAISLTVGLISPALYYMVFRNTGQLAFLSKPRLHDITRLVYFLAADEGKFRKPLSALYLLCCGAGVRVIFSRWRMPNTVRDWGLVVTLSCALLPVAVTFIISFWFPIFFPRYLLICLPAMVLLAAQGLVVIRPVWVRGAVGILIVGLSAACLMWYYAHPKDDWRSLTAYLLAHSQPGDTIVGCPPGAEWPVQYYAAAMSSARTPQFHYVTSGVLLQHIHAGPIDPARFWVVTWGDNIPDAEAIPQEVAPLYRRVDKQYFFGPLTVALYEKDDP